MVHRVKNILPGESRRAGLRAAIGSSEVRREEMPFPFSGLFLPWSRIEIVAVPPRMEVYEERTRSAFCGWKEEARLPLPVQRAPHMNRMLRGGRRDLVAFPEAHRL